MEVSYEMQILMHAAMYALGIATGIMLKVSVDAYREGSRYKKAALAAERRRKIVG